MHKRMQRVGMGMGIDVGLKFDQPSRVWTRSVQLGRRMKGVMVADHGCSLECRVAAKVAIEKKRGRGSSNDVAGQR